MLSAEELPLYNDSLQKLEAAYGQLTVSRLRNVNVHLSECVMYVRIYVITASKGAEVAAGVCRCFNA